MKALALVLAVIALIAIAGSPVVGLAVGIVVGILVLQFDALTARVRALEASLGAAQTGRAPSVDEAAPPAPPPAMAPIPAPAPAGPLYWGQQKAEPTERRGEARSGWWSDWKLPALGELESLVAGRGLAIVGGVALTLGILFFLGLAFSRGWIGPEERVVIGLVAGALIFGLGGWILLRGRQIVAHVLVAVGLAALTVSLFAATQLYGFIPGELGVGAALAVAAITALLAIRGNSQTIAGFGLVAVLAAPPVMGASPTLLTIAFLGVALAGTTAIALFRSWRWLPPVAFLLAAPQFASYLQGSPMLAIALPALGIFWLLHALAAGGEELRVLRGRLSETSATLLVANAAFVTWAGFELLDGPLEPVRGVFLLAVTAAHLLLALPFLLRDDRHPFGMLAFGTGIAALTLAAPIQLGASIVPMAWAAEAVALTWIFVERRHGYSGIAAVVLGALAAAHTLVFEYPIDLSPALLGGIPFLNAEGAALGFVLAAAAAAIWLVPSRPTRVAIAASAGALVVLAARFELDGATLVAFLTLAAVACLLVQKRLLNISLRTQTPRLGLTQVGERALFVTAGLAIVHVSLTTLADQLPPPAFLDGLRAWATLPSVPFVNEATLVAAILIAGALSVALIIPGRTWRSSSVLVAAGVLAYLVPSQAGPAVSVAVWSLLGVVLFLYVAGWTPQLRFAPHAFIGAAVLEALGVVASPDRLIVQATPFPEAALFNGATLAVAALTIAFAIRARLEPRDREGMASAGLAAVFGVYLVSIATVDLFQVRLGGPIALEELQKQAQVALSVVWAIIGVAAMVFGLARQLTPARIFGLALLGLVTLKVFIVDLAALDVAYRVLSFGALGVLLLGAAYLYSRFQPAPETVKH
ncbi:MAG: DUF2339 domain-containing protein [Chloroflexota bacterium]|nr:DUF2339 domain-containing protein [Chloroflexota bacterium]